MTAHQECVCFFEPRGDSGLEGYSAGEIYICQFRKEDVFGKPYYRVWPSSADYYETCSVKTFNRFFKLRNQIAS